MLIVQISYILLLTSMIHPPDLPSSILKMPSKTDSLDVQDWEALLFGLAIGAPFGS